jgi:hypothetical protein
MKRKAKIRHNAVNRPKTQIFKNFWKLAVIGPDNPDIFKGAEEFLTVGDCIRVPVQGHQKTPALHGLQNGPAVACAPQGGIHKNFSGFHIRKFHDLSSHDRNVSEFHD